ncbi:trimeric intracellular cation channel family protein [Aliamphritea spongicola]|uniref:trimeric intracellular cation channel family protein n=1 Tax=Aliamphritea spongicola TaxID=707589 RepID=UPI001FAFCEFD|nr:trimeric intracellular cation channel family protein [Aliamphritea spongicola]
MLSDEFGWTADFKMNLFFTLSEFVYVTELLGVAVFAITGALAAQGKHMDILGVVVLAIVTSLGGGTIRDLTLDIHPLLWIQNDTYIWTAVISAVSAFWICRYLRYPRRLLIILDALGMALFTVLGAQKAISLDLPPIIVVMMAMVTGCAGGMVRDVLTRQIPLILHRHGELYATCSIIGAVLYVWLEGSMHPVVLVALSISIIFIIRMAAVFGDICLPEFIVAGHKLERRDDKERG